MAIRLSNRYPGQFDNSDPTGWPDGAPRNEITPDDGTGTPLEEGWVKDWEALKQSILQEAGVTANDTPDKVGASQVFDAVIQLFRPVAARYTIGTGGSPTLTAQFSEGYTLVTNQIEVPHAGVYLVSWCAAMTTTGTTIGDTPELSLSVGGSVVASAATPRLTASAANVVVVKQSIPVVIATPASQRLSLAVGATAGTPAVASLTLPSTGSVNFVSVVSLGLR